MHREKIVKILKDYSCNRWQLEFVSNRSAVYTSLVTIRFPVSDKIVNYGDNFRLKETVSVIVCEGDPPCKISKCRFTTVSFI